jgi:hypothetical protein
MAVEDRQPPHRIGLFDRPVFQARLASDAAQHAVDEARAAAMGELVRLLHGLVDRGVRGHPVQEEELVGGDAQRRVEHGLDLVEAPAARL